MSEQDNSLDALMSLGIEPPVTPTQTEETVTDSPEAPDYEQLMQDSELQQLDDIPITPSQVLHQLQQENSVLLPKMESACQRCVNSLWFTSKTEVKCYCRVMFMITHSSKEPSQIQHCDGEYLLPKEE